MNNSQESTTPGAEAGNPSGIVAALGELGPGAVITEAALAKMFGRCSMSVKRAVQRGEIPPPAKLFGAPCWTAGALVKHIEKRLEAAAKEAGRAAQRFQELRP